MKPRMFWVRLCLFLLLASLVLAAVACGGGEELSFATLSDSEARLAVDGERVSLLCYLVTNSPTDGELLYVTSRPYERLLLSSDKSCVLPVYLRRAGSVRMTTQIVRVSGRLELSGGEPFVTEVGYAFSVRLTDATVEAVDGGDLPASVAPWQDIAASDFVNNMMDALNYVHFTCAWNTYSGKNDDGTQFYLEPAHAESFIKDARKQYHYGYSDGYFDRLRATARSFSSDKCDELVALLDGLQALAARGLASLDGGNYSQESVGAEDILDGFVGYKYTVNDAQELIEDYEELYGDFTAWLGLWELP